MRRTGLSRADKVAFGSLALLVTGSLVLLAVDVLAQPLSRGTLATGIILLLLLPAVLLGQYAPAPYRLPYAWRWALLGLQALMTYLPVLVFERPWLSLLGFLAGAVLLTVPRPASVVVALAVTASGPALVHSSLVSTHRSGMSVLVSTLITSSAVYAVVHLALLVARLQASHAQAARLAEYRERARMAQELHDLFGSSLVSIAVQSENALRRMPSSAPGYQVLGEIATLARRAHAEVRGIAADRFFAQLRTELDHARRVLVQAGIVTRVSVPPHPEIPGPVSHCLVAVVREGIGNVLQHSRARWCGIEVTVHGSHIRLTVDNDGVSTAPAAARHGSGLASLRLRCLALGGTLETRTAQGRFVLAARLPLNPSVPLGDTDGVHQGASV
jgi:two-component system sensor histidine kinase DesK